MDEARKGIGRQEEGDRTREKILEVSLGLFSAQGYHQTSITQIVEKADTYRSAIEWHFGGKEGLLLAVLDYYFEQKFITDIRDRWTRFLAGRHEYDGNSVFTFFFKEIYGMTQANLGIIQALFTLTFERLHHDAQVSKRVRHAWQRISDTFTWVVEMGQKDGLIDAKVEPRFLGMNILALGQGVFMQWYLNPTEETARQAVSQFLHGLKFYVSIPIPADIWEEQ